MRYRLAIILLLVLSGSNTGCTKPVTTSTPPLSSNPGKMASRWTFDNDPAAGLPAGMVVFSGNWSVRIEPGTPSAPNALCQTGKDVFPALILDNTVYTDFTVQTSFKPVSGNTDRAAGIIFRVQDKNNYYILRANALENSINIYKYVNGTRVVLKEGAAPVASNQWQDLRVEVSGVRIRGLLNGQPVVETVDETFKSGRVGLWTKADSVTCFDDVAIFVP